MRLIYVAFILSLAFMTSAQCTEDNKRIISGNAYDYDTKEPISNASLELADLSTDKCPGSLSDGFDKENATLWRKSNWTNNDPIYLNTWKSDFNHIRIEDGNLSLNLDNQPCVDNKSQCQNQSFASGEYGTTCDQYRYGELEARILAGKGNGVITGMFFLGGIPGKQDEIDAEIFGKDAVKPGQWEMQTNYYSKGNMGNCHTPYGIPEPCHVAIIPLNFDPTQSYHIYKISWIGEAENCNEIKWYVDGKLRRDVWLDEDKYIQSNVFDENGNIIEADNRYKGSLPAQKSKIFLSLWAAGNWSEAGNFNYSSEKPIYAKIDWVTYSRLNSSYGG
jgi:beta-glucanase (GH16 family)